jgi:hypothetical protein
MRRSLVVTLALLAIVRSPAVAQTCMGMASFSSGPVQIAGNAAFTDGANRLGASAAYGLPGSVFGSVGIGTTSIDGLDSSLDFGVDLGYQMQVGKAQICPVASLGYDNGPDSDSNGINSSTRSAGFGLAMGAPMGTSQLQIVPTAGLGLIYAKSKVEITGFGSGEGSDAYGVAQLGLGLVVNQTIAIRPSVAIPLGLTGSDPSFGVTVGFNFGK